jgi:hypothetical protein
VTVSVSPMVLCIHLDCLFKCLYRGASVKNTAGPRNSKVKTKNIHVAESSKSVSVIN